MYTACIYCHKPLGSNEVIESFPVGRRLAFDGTKGRLGVVCRGWPMALSSFGSGRPSGPSSRLGVMVISSAAVEGGRI